MMDSRAIMGKDIPPEERRGKSPDVHQQYNATDVTDYFYRVISQKGGWMEASTVLKDVYPCHVKFSQTAKGSYILFEMKSIQAQCTSATMICAHV
jgi:hypothetical protein